MDGVEKADKGKKMFSSYNSRIEPPPHEIDTAIISGQTKENSFAQNA